MENSTPLFRPTLVFLGLFTLLTGVIYPLAVWGIGQTIFPRQANGSLIEMNGRAIGSELISQRFTRPEWFWPRGSAVDYNAASSGGSNLAPSNPALSQAVEERTSTLRAGDPTGAIGPVPVDLVTSSGSGLDPHITLASAHYQASRIATARGLELKAVERLISEHIEGRTFGLLGEPRVNVLRLNLSLVNISGKE